MRLIRDRRTAPLRFPMPKWDAGKAAMLAGTRNARILCVGDSTTCGYNTAGTGWTDGREFSFPTELAAIIPRGSVESIFINPGVDTIANLQLYDPRLSISADWTVGSQGLGGSWMQCASPNTDVFSFTPGRAIDTVEIWYIQLPTGGSFDWEFDGGGTTTVDTAGSNASAFTSATVSLGTHTVNIRRSAGGTVFLLGFIAYDSSSKEVSVVNLGVGGQEANYFSLTSSAWMFNPSVPLLAPDLTIINLTINDAVPLTAIATYRTEMNTIISKCKATGDVLLMTGNPIAVASATVDEQRRYYDVCRDLAQAYGINFLNLNDEWGGLYTQANARGLMADSTHMNAAGSRNCARLLKEYLF